MTMSPHPTPVCSVAFVYFTDNFSHHGYMCAICRRVFPDIDLLQEDLGTHDVANAAINLPVRPGWLCSIDDGSRDNTWLNLELPVGDFLDHVGDHTVKNEVYVKQEVDGSCRGDGIDRSDGSPSDEPGEDCDDTEVLVVSARRNSPCGKTQTGNIHKTRRTHSIKRATGAMVISHNDQDEPGKPDDSDLAGDRVEPLDRSIVTWMKYSIGGLDPAELSRDPAGLLRDPAGLSRDPAELSRDPAGLSRDPAGLSIDSIGPSVDPMGLSSHRVEDYGNSVGQSDDLAGLSGDPVDLAELSGDPAELSSNPAEHSDDPAKDSRDPAIDPVQQLKRIELAGHIRNPDDGNVNFDSMGMSGIPESNPTGLNECPVGLQTGSGSCIDLICDLPGLETPHQVSISLDQEPRPTQTRRQTNKVKRSQLPQDVSYICDRCDYTTRHRSNFNRHMMTHTGGHFYCTEPACRSKFTARSELKRHINYTHHGEKLACSQCERRFESKQGLRRHRAVDHKVKSLMKYRCDVCCKDFYDRNEFSRHLISHTKSRTHVCSSCHAAFMHRSSLQRHERDCDGPGKPGDRLNTCDQCNASFPSHRQLEQHRAGKHAETLRDCICGKSFKWQTSLARHQRLCRFKCNDQG